MPTISVIVPAYNAEQTIMATISSVLQQTFSDFELIVIDDGSTDRTLELLSTLKDPRLKIFSYRNGGVSVARNHGLSHAKGDFIALLDADDLWTPDKLELQLVALQQYPEAGVAYSWTCFMDEDGKSFHADSPKLATGNVYAQLLVDNFILTGSNCLIRKQAVESVGEFDSTLGSAEDWDYWIRLAMDWSFVVVPKLQVFYRKASGSLSSKVEVMEESTLKVIDKAFQAAPSEMQFLKNQSLANSYRYLSYTYFTRLPNAHGTNQATQKLWAAIRLRPIILRDSWTRRLLLKILLIRLISPKIGFYILQSITNLRHNFRFKQSMSERN